MSQDFGGYDGKGDGVGEQAGHWDQTSLDIVSDITAIPRPDASFDAVMCIEVLEHLPNPVKAMQELTRLLKPDGVLLLTAPFCSITHLAPYFFHTGYSQYFYTHWLKVLGYTIEEIETNGSYFEYIAQELRRLPSVGERYSDIKPTWIERNAIDLTLGLLQRFSQHDQGSEKLLCFGLHVLARKH